MSALSARHAPPPRPTQEHWWAMLADTAYILPISEDDHVCYGIFAADGTPLAVAPTRAIAMAMIRRNELRPADAH